MVASGMKNSAEPLWREQLELVQVPQGYWPNVYVLGVQANRITFSDQQKRAFNLIAGLMASGRLVAGDKLAVIGGGVGGVTAAAFGANSGLVPTVIERHSLPMMIQQGSNRWLHPNLYDWPWRSWGTTHTRFPCMNWSAGTAGEVIAGLRREWQFLVQSGRVSWCGNTPVVSLRREHDSWIVNDASSGQHGPFKAVILSVGFGEDESHTALDGKPYWRDDDIHQRARSAARILVSGCGDGGLIDAIRCLSIDFRHASLGDMATKADNSAIRDHLIRVEADRPRYPDGKKLTEAYLELEAPEVDRLLAASVKPDTVVTLNSRNDAPLLRAASVLNRFLIARLIRLGKVTHLPGPLDSASITRSDSAFTVPIGRDSHSFDQVVIRHGPRPPAIQVFADIASSLELAKRFFSAYPHVVDRTRQRLWEEILPIRSAPAFPSSASAQHTDDRVMEHLGERAHELLKAHLHELLTAPLVTRRVLINQVHLAVEVGDVIIGNVTVTVESSTDAAVKVARERAADVIHEERVRLLVGSTSTDDLGRALRTAAFLLGGQP